MRSLDRRALGRPRISRRPAIERLETRDLMASASAGTVSNALVGSRPPGSFLNPAVIQQAVNTLYPPGSALGTPTPREIRRETFTARWEGTYTIGVPRFSDRGDTIHIYGVSGGANQFLKGKFQIALFPPANPSATPTPGNPYANQVTGVAGLVTQNYLQSGGLLALDLNAPGNTQDPSAMPTKLTWTYDSNTSAGPYSAPGGVPPGQGFTQGTGELDIQYHPAAHPEPGTLGSGTVVVTFQGLINTSQIVSAVSKFIS
jgi:hypothetical protein